MCTLLLLSSFHQTYDGDRIPFLYLNDANASQSGEKSPQRSPPTNRAITRQNQNFPLAAEIERGTQKRLLIPSQIRDGRLMLEKELYHGRWSSTRLGYFVCRCCQNMHSSAIGTHYTSLSSSCSLPKIHCQTSFICTVTDELSEVSPSILVFAAYQLHAQPTIHPTNPALFEPSPISSPTDEMQTLTGRRGGFISPTSKSSFHVALLTELLYMQKIPSFPAASIETSSPPLCAVLPCCCVVRRHF